MYENEAMNGSNAFKPAEMMDMLHNRIFAKTISGATPDVRERSMQKNFVDALIIAASENQGVKDGVTRSLDADPAAMMLVNPSEHACFGCPLHSHERSAHSLGEHAPGRRNLNFYGSQGNRVSDAISLKRGELMRIRNLLMSHMSSASRDARYHYEDLVMRINTALGIAQLKN